MNIKVPHNASKIIINKIVITGVVNSGNYQSSIRVLNEPDIGVATQIFSEFINTGTYNNKELDISSRTTNNLYLYVSLEGSGKGNLTLTGITVK